MSEETQGNRWRARPVVAFGLRLAIVAVPLLAGYGATVLLLRLWHHQLASSRWWLVPVAAASIVVCLVIERLTRRLLPLAALLKLSLLFPDRAPSRFKIARKSVSTRTLEEQLAAPRHNDAASAAQMVLTLITALTAHDRRTRGHSERVRVFAELLAEQLRLPRDARDRLRWASLLHDIGKLQVAVDILNKPAKLSDIEFDLVAQHPANGAKLLGPLVDWLGEWGGAIRQHHEKYDGTGYPDHLAGTDISRAGRIVCIADSFEVMTAHRAYKKPMATAAARAELARCAGTQFDPVYVRAFLAISLPRLLWAMGPGSLLMNLPLLRAVADVSNKGVLASAQTGAAAASAAAVIGGTSAFVGLHAQVQTTPAAAVQTIVAGATQAPTHTSKPPLTVAGPTPTTDPTPTPDPTVTQTQSPDPTPTADPIGRSTPTPTASSPVAPAAPVAPAVTFTSVPAATVAASTVTIGYSANASAATLKCSVDGAAATVCGGTSATFSALADGSHTITMWAEDSSGTAGASVSTTFTVDTVAPTVTWTSVPPAQSASSSVAAAFSVDDPDATTWCSLDGGPTSACSSPLSFTGLPDGTHSLTVFPLDEVGNVGATISTTFTTDTTGPTLTLTSVPAATIATASASVAFTSDDGTATSWCSIDGGTATVCTSPVSLTGLADGSHTVDIHGVDPLGNVGATVHSAFVVDTTAPVVTFTSVPSGVVPSKSVSIGFAIDDPTATATCSLNGGPAATCYSPVSFDNLANGNYTVDVQATDPVGNVGTASFSFSVNSTAPTVTVTSAPAHLTNSTTATVAFAVDDPTATAWCSLDGATATVCTSPISYSGLADGPHTIAIYGVSAAALTGSTITTGFTVDTVAPVVSVPAPLTGSIRSVNASLAFSTNDPTATIYCAIDAGTATACTSPLDLSALAEGAHTVSLYARDPAGNQSSTVQDHFTIDNTAPVTTFTTPPPSTVAGSTATATASFSTNDSTAQAWCSLDGAAAQTCTGSVTYTGLSAGGHTISVYAIDPAGNRGATVSTSFTIVTAAPVFTSVPSGVTFGIVTYDWTATPGLTYQYSFDGVNWSTTTTTSSNSSLNLIPGSYTFRLRGVDSLGNHTAVATAASFSVI